MNRIKAIKVVRSHYPASMQMLNEALETLIPELKQSEDERIKEAIIATIHLYYGEPLEDEAKEMIAWLEKQGEKKPFWSEKIIADVFEKVGLAKIVREQGNDELMCAVQSAMIELEKQDEQNTNWSGELAKNMFIKALEQVEEQNSKGYKLTDCDKNSWWEDFKTYTSFTIKQKSAWGKEDENHVDSLLKRLDGLCRKEFASTRFAISEDEDWLKSLKGRIQSKQFNVLSNQSNGVWHSAEEGPDKDKEVLVELQSNTSRLPREEKDYSSTDPSFLQAR